MIIIIITLESSLNKFKSSPVVAKCKEIKMFDSEGLQLGLTESTFHWVLKVFIVQNGFLRLRWFSRYICLNVAF